MSKMPRKRKSINNIMITNARMGERRMTMKITKQELLDRISSMPDDTQIFVVESPHDVLDIKVFTEPKDEKFLEWYFGV